MDPTIENLRQAAKESKTLSSSAKAAIILRARDKRPETARQLWLYMRGFFKLTMPYKPCCKDHLTPFHMVYFMFHNIYPEFAAMGSRASMKTLGFAASETLDLHFNIGNLVHIGAIDKQAHRCYSYVKKFLMLNFRDRVQESLMVRTTMTSGNTLEIIPCTMNQVNGPHESKVRFDEVELANPMAYSDAKGIPVSNPITGEPPSIVYTSTRKFPLGLFEQELRRLKRQRSPVITFCYKDVTERCQDSRSGVTPVTVYIDRTTFVWDIFQRTKEMKPFQVYDGCLKCILLPTCCGDLKNAHGVVPIEDIIIRFKSATPDFWISQGECRKPMRKGLMIYNFPFANFEKIDWTKFLRDDGTFNTERYMMVMGKDFNWNPDATLVAVIDMLTDHIYFIKEFSHLSKTMPFIARKIIEWCQRTPFKLPSDMQCDKSEPGLISTLQGEGLGMAMAVDESDVEGGVDLLNYLCRPFDRPSFVTVDPEGCPTFCWECNVGYVRKTDPRTGEPGDEPLAKNNHFVDCARYIVWKHLRKYANPYGVYSGGVDTFESVVTDLSGSLDTSNGMSYEDQLATISIILGNN